MASTAALRAGWGAALIILATGARADAAPLQRGPPEPSQGDATSDSVSLAPMSEAPWNPPGTVSPRLPWEQVVLLPGRIVSLPLVGLGAVTRHSMFYLESRGRIPIAPGAPRAKIAPMIGFEVLGLGDRTGLGGAVAVTPHLAVTKTPTRPSFSTGDTIEYQIVITNDGDVPLQTLAVFASGAPPVEYLEGERGAFTIGSGAHSGVNGFNRSKSAAHLNRNLDQLLNL